jgi:hypothetical protein
VKKALNSYARPSDTWRANKHRAPNKVPLSAMSRATVLIVLAAAALGACTTPAQRRAAENAAIKKEAATEIKRICSLPEDERQAQLKRLKDEQGVVISCGRE